jgi:hypothetical protein
MSRRVVKEGVNTDHQPLFVWIQLDKRHDKENTPIGAKTASVGEKYNVHL